jgi:HAD superfamily hydrolase (TIGR01484 family)
MLTLSPLNYSNIAANTNIRHQPKRTGGSNPLFGSEARSMEQISNKLIQVLKNQQQLLISLDMDGTLFPYNSPYRDFNDSKIDTITSLAEELYKKNGYPSLIICTGRAISQVSKLTKGTLKGKPVIIVGEDGGHIFNCHTGTDISLLKPTEKLHLKEFNKLFAKNNTDPTIEPIGKNKFLLMLDHVSEVTRKTGAGTVKRVIDIFKEKYPDSNLHFKDLFNFFVVAPTYFNKEEGFKALQQHLKTEYDDAWPEKKPPFSVHIGDGKNDNSLFKYLNQHHKGNSLSLFVGPNHKGIDATYHMEPDSLGKTTGAVGKTNNLDSDEQVFRYELSRIRTKLVWRLLRSIDGHLLGKKPAVNKSV